MKRGNIFLKKFCITAALTAVFLFTSGFKVTSIYPTAEERKNVAGEETEMPAEEAEDVSIPLNEGDHQNSGVMPADALQGVLPEVIQDNGADIYLVGDSRTVYAYTDLPDTRANWLAACGTSYPYFIEHYVPILDRADLRGKKIVILYGVNDISCFGKEIACQNWIDFYNNKAQEWIDKGAKVYACSVMGFNYRSIPDESTSGFSDIIVMNRNVDDYNAMVESMLPVNIGYIRLKFSTDEPLRDGVHYSTEEDIRIYGGIIDYLSTQ